MDLFESARAEKLAKNTPLAARMRPRTLDEFIGQGHILGPGRLLRRAIQIDQITSLLFYGPPGTGKTTLARVIAGATKSHFLSINAVLAGVKDIREAIDTSEKILGTEGIKTVLFVDEVHRFNKSQQDALLPHVESGLLTLIGATTENPYFEVNKALVSRSRIFELRSLENADLARVAQAALADPERGYGKMKVQLSPDGLAHLVQTASGDARALLNALELAVETTAPDPDGVVHLDLRICEDSIQKKAVLYDKDGDAHYDIISAFIKSVRGSDPDAALYWMARMVYAGEDPRYIFRRMIILASEDVGLADPTALPAVMAASQAFDYVGLPEGRFHLSQACLHLATAPKSNSTMAFFDALKSVEKERVGEVPLPMRDASRDSEDFGHGKNYLYPHAFRDHWVAQDYLPAELRGRVFYQPGELGYEKEISGDVETRREIRIAQVLESRKDEGDTAFREITFNEDGASLQSIRDKLFQWAGFLRDKLIFIPNADNGLLFWEALRKEGVAGVHALVASEERKNLLESRIPPSIPKSLYQVRVAADQTLDTFFDDNKPIRFDLILSLDWLATLRLEGGPDSSKKLKDLKNHLAGDGRWLAAERLKSLSPRLYELADRPQPDWEKLREKVASAEEAVYSQNDRPDFRLKPEEAISLFQQNNFVVHRRERERHQQTKYFTDREVSRWFEKSGNAGLPSYRDRLSKTLSESQIEQVAAHYKKVLSAKSLPWRSEVLFLELGNA